MSLALVRHGDPTTTRGFVTALSSTMFDEGKHVALHGDEATCGNCKGVFKIVGTGDGVSENNRNAVVHGDKVLCPCGKNRVIAGGDAGCRMTRDSGRTSAAGSAVPAGALAAQSGAARHDEQFTLHDANDGVLYDTYYTVRLPSGSLVHGVTDSLGRTKRYTTEGSQRLRVYLGHREA